MVVSTMLALGVAVWAGSPAHADDSEDAELTISVVAPTAPAVASAPLPSTGAEPDFALFSAGLLLATGGLAVRLSLRVRNSPLLRKSPSCL